MEEKIINKYGQHPSLREYTEYSNFCIEHQCFDRITFDMWKFERKDMGDYLLFGKPFWEEAHKLHRDKYYLLPFNDAFLTIVGELPSPIIINKELTKY